MIIGDEASRTTDRELGYFLAISFGRVKYCDSKQVSVDWLFLEKYSSKLRLWRLAEGVVYSSLLSEHEVLTNEQGIPMKATLDSQSKLTKSSLAMIRNEIGQEEFDKHV